MRVPTYTAFVIAVSLWTSAHAQPKAPASPLPSCIAALSQRPASAQIGHKLQLGGIPTLESTFLIEENPNEDEKRTIRVWMAGRQECYERGRTWAKQYAPALLPLMEETNNQLLSYTQRLLSGMMTYADYAKARTNSYIALVRKIRQAMQQAGNRSHYAGEADTAASTTSVVPASTFNLAELSAGETPLSCGFACSAQYGFNRHKLKQLHDSNRWTELAKAVADISYANDQALYYLGRAAEGLGYVMGARLYYEKAASAQKCAGVLDVCDGFNIPDLSRSRLSILAAAERAAADRAAVARAAEEARAAAELKSAQEAKAIAEREAIERAAELKKANEERQAAEKGQAEAERAAEKARVNARAERERRLQISAPKKSGTSSEASSNAQETEPTTKPLEQKPKVKAKSAMDL